MRRSYTQEFYVDGKVIQATVLEEPNIDDVMRVEARIYAHGYATSKVDETRVVDRGVRDLLVRFGVGR